MRAETDLGRTWRRPVLAPVLLAVVVAACAGSPSAPLASPPASVGISETRLPGNTRTVPPTVSITPVPAALSIPVVPCRPDDTALAVEFGSPPPPVLIPLVVPSSLPTQLVPEGAVVVGVGVPGAADLGEGAWLHYVVGGPAMECRVALGTTTEIELLDSAGTSQVRTVHPWSVGASLLVACPYVDAARMAAASLADDDTCHRDPSETAVEIETAARDTNLVLVSKRDKADEQAPAVRLVLYQGDAEGGTSSSIECRMPASHRSTCTASFAFHLAQAGFAPGDVEAIIERIALDVP